MRPVVQRSLLASAIVAATLAAGSAAVAVAPADASGFPAGCPWMDTGKSPDQHARLLLDASSLQQKPRWLDE
ncbi:hypothetical protein [Dactylosporangium sp. CA-233914]|uniref:hypothetical protein n=1 Tax=Dactylosporangium sp. CA-233914 TaxID=3239934 RepID=UPI003D8D33DD